MVNSFRPLRHVMPVLTLPTTVAVVIPVLLVLFGPEWTTDTGAFGPLLRLLGGAALLLGLTLVTWTVRLFDRRGDGTLAPWDPPKHLVLRGPYRHVRNPMISGVLLVLLGEALLLLSPVLLGWFAVFFAINQTYIPLWEEPVLRRRFGAEYDEYRRNVWRWVPRLRGWDGRGTA